MLSFGEAVKLAFTKNYCNFKGRASRSEYWWFVLATTIVSIVISPLGYINELMGSVVNIIFTLAILLPNIGLVIRRFHDIGRSGWWYGGMCLAGIVAVALIGAGFAMMTMGGDHAMGGMLILVGMLITLAVGVWSIVWCCKASQPESNRYGDVPWME